MTPPAGTKSAAASTEAGFVLPVALFVMVILSMISAVALYSARNDYRAAATTRAAAVARAAADAGIDRTLAMWSASVPTLPPSGDSVVIDWQALPDGSSYRIVVYRPPVDPADVPSSNVVMYSTGRSSGPIEARRTLVGIATPAAGGAVCCDAGFKVQSRLRVTGRDRRDPIPELDGTDRAPPGWPASRCTAPLADVPGAVSSEARRVEIRRGGDIAGSPLVLEDASITAADFTDFGGTTYAGLAATANVSFTGDQRFNNNQIGPRISGGSCDPSIPTNWGSPLTPGGVCGDYMPIVHIAGNVSFRGAGQGQGILLVDGDADFNDDFVFYGVVIVLGRARVRGDVRIYGGLMARGDIDGGARSSVEGRAKVAYSSCSISNAQGGLVGGSTQPAPGRSWFEVIG